MIPADFLTKMLDASRRTSSPTAFSRTPSFALTPDKDVNDQTTDDFTQVIDVREAQEPVEESDDEERDSVESDDSENDDLLVPDAYEPEIEIDWESLLEEETFEGVLEKVALTFTETLHAAILAYGEQRKPQRNITRALEEVEGDAVVSGALSSCWGRVERHAARGWQKGNNGKYVRIQTRGEREDPPKFYYHRATKKVRDAVSGEIVEMQMLHFSSDEAVDSVRRRWANNSTITFAIFDLTMDQARLVEVIDVRYPAGDVRQFPRDTGRVLKRLKKGQWRQASMYCKRHVKGFRIWLWESGHDARLPL